MPVTPDVAGKAAVNAAPVVDKAAGKKHTLGPTGKTGEGTRPGRGRRAHESPTGDATAQATTAQAPVATPTATVATATTDTPTTGQGDAQTGQQTQQQARQDTPQQGDVKVDALANVTTSTATTAHTAHVHTPAPAVATAAPAQPAAVVPFTQDSARFEHLVEGLSAKLHVSRAEGGSSLRMTLRPEELGQVTVRLQVGADGLTTASVTADSQQAASLLADAADDLRKALADRGVQLDKLDVSSGGAGSTPGDPRADSQQQSNQTSRDGNAPRSFYSFRAETEAAVTASAVDAREGETGHSYLA